MKKQVLAVAAVCVGALALASGLAWAAETVSVDVPFAFFVAKDNNEMPAGRYELRLEGDDESRLLIRSTTGSGAAVALVLERLADTGSKEPTVVFDKVEGKRYLSEVHIPGTDSFLVGIAKGKETHEVLTGKK